MGGLAVTNPEDDPVVLARGGQHVAILHPCCKWERHNMAGTVVLVCGCFDSQFVFEGGVAHHWRRLLNQRLQDKGSRDGQVGVGGNWE